MQPHSKKVIGISCSITTRERRVRSVVRYKLVNGTVSKVLKQYNTSRKNALLFRAHETLEPKRIHRMAIL